jgi:hypothetical protein
MGGILEIASSIPCPSEVKEDQSRLVGPHMSDAAHHVITWRNIVELKISLAQLTSFEVSSLSAVFFFIQYTELRLRYQHSHEHISWSFFPCLSNRLTRQLIFPVVDVY